MPHRSFAAHGARFGAARAGATERRRQDLLADLGDRFDQLQCDVSIGATSHREVERQVAEAEAIADGIRALFRSPTQDNAPRWQRGGKAFW